VFDQADGNADGTLTTDEYKALRGQGAGWRQDRQRRLIPATD
jgi:hypothetical protein